MKWVRSFLWSSIGKKLMMALTGLGFILFLLVHLGGNLTVYAGRQAFNSYSEHLHALGPLVTVAEWGLLLMAAVHIITGLTLFYQNFTARPVRYQQHQRAGGRTLGSATMPYTGLLILAFVVFHLINFHFTDRTGTTIYDIVRGAFASPLYVVLYVVAMIIVAIHVSHGFWSLLQTLGANHPQYMPFIHKAGLACSLIFGFGFGCIPLYLSLVV